ncbi:MAG: phytoene desaturase [Calditrichaeota bacterium]|nr:MAG: phytoene desaturase [Calditrichota bacterium]
MKKIAVIGSGFSGLSAAAFLAQQGHHVSVFEKNSSLGGRARVFTAQGFKFDMGPSWYWMPEIFDRFFKKLGADVNALLELQRLDPAFSAYFGLGDYWEIPDDETKLINLFESTEYGAGQKLENLLERAAFNYHMVMKDVIFKSGEKISEYCDPLLIYHSLKFNIFKSFASHTRSQFSDPRLLRILEFPILFLGGTPQNIPALYTIMNYAGHSLGTWYPTGGLNSLINAMVHVARNLNVQIHENANVTGINIESGTATSLRVDGENIDVDYVVAAADYHHVEQKLLAPEWRRYTPSYWDKRVLAPSCLIFYLGIKGKIGSLRHHTLFFDQNFDRHLDAIYSEARWPANPLFYVCCPSKSDATVAPPDCENLFILVPIAAGLENSHSEHERIFQNITARFAHLTGHDIRPRIVFKRTYSVNEFANDYNAFKGNAYGLANTLKQTALMKPKMKSKKVRNLYFAGQLTVPGPGVPPSLISGEIAANLVKEAIENEITI